MDDTIKRLQTLKSKLVKAQEERSKAEGRLEVSMQQLEQIGYDTVEEAEAALEELEAKIEKRMDQLDNKVTKFLEEYDELI